MRFIFSKWVIGVILLFLIVGGFIVFRNTSTEREEEKIVTPVGPKDTLIGRSVEGREINARTYGTGPTHLVFVGGIHGGYEWNSVLLAYEAIDYFDSRPDMIPDDLSVTIIPVANPDGLFAVVGTEGRFLITDAIGAENQESGRFNANEVDLNRNFDCKWQKESSWKGKTVSAGESAFSEPEAVALRDFLLKAKPKAVVFWHSQANAVYASECEDGILPATRTTMNAYAKAAGYPAVDEFDAYTVTGDAEGWLASVGIPAITVELKTHDAIEWERNLAGVDALFTLFSVAK